MNAKQLRLDHQIIFRRHIWINARCLDQTADTRANLCKLLSAVSKNRIFSCRWVGQTTDHFQKGRFAGSVPADKSIHRSPSYMHVQPVHCLITPKLLC